MDWKECKDRRFVKEISSDQSLIKSLINSSNKKLESNKRLELDETTSSTKVSIAYESLREILEALAIQKGFKIYNHECFCSFLNEICGDKFSSREFDKFRRIRNKVNYYGEDISFEEAKMLISEINILRENLLKILNEEYE